MKIVCTKKNLNQGLSSCSRIIGSGNALPVLNNILLKTENGRVKISSTNLELAINTWVGGKIEEEGDITVPARLINDYVGNLPEEKLTLSTKEQTLYLEAEQSKSHIKGLSSDEFPLIPQISEGVYTKTNGDELARGLKGVVFASSYSETQPEISGVLFSFKDDLLTLTATDRYRLAEAKISLSKAVSEAKQVIVPIRAAIEAARLNTGQKEVEVYVSEGQIMLKSPNTELITRLIEGQYPDYQQIIPKNFTTEAEIKTDDLVQALKAVSLFAQDNNNIEIEAIPEKKKIIVRSQASQTGDSEISVDAKVNGKKNTVIFNHRYLLDCLNNLADEEVIVKLIDAASPAAITPRGRDNYLYIVMPIKT